MESIMKLKILTSIGNIYEQSMFCKLEDSFFEQIDSELTFLSSYFQTTKIQSFFIAMVFSMNFSGDTVDMNDLIEHFGCNPMKMLEYTDEFEALCKSGIFKKKKQKNNQGTNPVFSNDQFSINEKIAEAVLQNEPIPEIKTDVFSDIYVWLENLYNLGLQRDENDITTRELFVQTKVLIETNLHFPLIQRIHRMELQIENEYFYLYLIWKTLLGRESTDIERATKGIFDNSTKQIIYRQDLFSGENELIRMHLIEIVEANFMNDAEIKLTDYSVQLLKECNIPIFFNKRRRDNILIPTEIPFRELIFSEKELDRIILLKNLLSDTNFTAMQRRLAERNLPKGITVMLYGDSGTGKTEVVKQIARETEREVMKVEISQSKSKWFGESEKIISRVFADYRLFVRECKKTPILFFNEADGIFSVRKEIGNSTVDKTENTIQAIILEEMENFEGILMATTNLIDNLDTAFERRFLFKIKFEKPSLSIRSRIWKSKIPSLSDTESYTLAEKFDFSGGQIENIVRKNEISQIISGEEITMNSLMDFCSEETFGNKNIKIGFSKSL
jgi:SpoVK/Ycf46/Vps4 family AAA+-type ATPase